MMPSACAISARSSGGASVAMRRMQRVTGSFQPSNTIMRSHMSHFHMLGLAPGVDSNEKKVVSLWC